MKVGDKLPVFTGVNQNGEEINSQEFLGKRTIIFFYPKANTPGCTAEACNLGDNYDELTRRGFQVIGISVDEVTRQKNFHSKYGFPYDLIADENKEICNLFGVWQLKKFMGREFMGVVRTTFIFDEKGICIKVINKVKTKTHTEQILAEI